MTKTKPTMPRYGVYMSHTEQGMWQVWTEDRDGVKQHLMNDYYTSDEAHAAVKRFKAGDKRRAAR